MKYPSIIFIFIFLIFSSCSVSGDLFTTWSKESIEKGHRLPTSSTYFSKDSSIYYSIWDYVMDWNNIDRDIYTDSLYNSTVKVEIENENTIYLTQIHQNKVIDSLRIKGRFENEYFVSEQKHKKTLIPLIFYQNLNEQLLFFNDGDENLVIHGLMFNEGAFLFICGNGGGNSIYKYKNTR